MTELERCDEEIRDHEGKLRTGHKDVAGLFRALLDWRTERRLLIETGEWIFPWRSAGRQRR